MPIVPISTKGPTIAVKNSAELFDAYTKLANTAGGGTIELVNTGTVWDTMRLDKWGTPDGKNPVVIRSADPDNPVEFSGVRLMSIENVRIENIHVDGTMLADPSRREDLLIQNSKNIQIVDSNFEHDMDNALKSAGSKLNSMGLVRNSDGVLLEGNRIYGHENGIQMIEVRNVDILDNDFSNIYADGIRGGGWQNVVIDGNEFHEFFGVSNVQTAHPDMIQVWGTSAQTLTQNVTISNNILMSGNGAAGQSIFIRNEEFGVPGDPTGGYFKNIVISGNLIYNGLHNGIRVANSDGVTVSDNTVLWNRDADIPMGDGTYVSVEPIINLASSRNGNITDNVMSADAIAESARMSGNVIVDYEDPKSANFVSKHFTNVIEGGDGDLRDIYMLPESPWYGKVGSELGYMPETFEGGILPIIAADQVPGDRYSFVFDGGESLGASGQTGESSGYVYKWTFSDGSTATGQVVTKTFDGPGLEDVTLEITRAGMPKATVTRDFEVKTKDIFEFDFSHGAVDLSENDAVAKTIGAGTAVNSDDGKGFLIGDGRSLDLSRSTDGLFQLDTFGLALDIKPVGDEQSGVFLNLFQTMRGSIDSTGRVEFSLTTDAGTFRMKSADAIFDDGQSHRIGLAYDGIKGQLEMFADGESVASVAATGVTAPARFWDLRFGNIFHDSMDAIIDNVVMSADPSVAGKMTNVAPPPLQNAVDDLVLDPGQEPEAADPAPAPPVQQAPPPPPPPPPPVQKAPVVPEPPVQKAPVMPEPPVQKAPVVPEPPVQKAPVVASDDDEEGATVTQSTSSGSSNFVQSIINAILRIFGLGGRSSQAEVAAEQDAGADGDEVGQVRQSMTLDQILPTTGTYDDRTGWDEDDEDLYDEAA